MADRKEGSKDMFKLRHGKPGKSKTTNTVKVMD